MNNPLQRFLLVGALAVAAIVARQAFRPDSRWWNLVMAVLLLAALVAYLRQERCRDP